MTDGLKGLELYFSTEKAEKGAERFRTAVDSAADAVERLGRAQELADKGLDKAGASAQGAAKGHDGLARSTRNTADAVEAMFRSLAQEEKLLKLSGAAREKYLSRIKAEGDVRRAGIALSSREAQDYIKRRIALDDQAKAAERSARAFSDLAKQSSAGLSTSATAVAKFDQRLVALNRTVLGLGGQFKAFLGIAGGAVLFRSGVRSITEYEDALRIMGSIAGATGDELRKLEKAAVETSRGTRFTPTETINGLTELARAGLNAEEAILAVKPTADLARVGLIGLSDASAIVTKTLTQFALSAEEAGRVADVLAKGANLSNADVSTLAQSLSKTGPVARQFGVDLEQTVAALSELADNGVQASISGTGLQRILLRLRTPTDEARAALEGLGLSVEQVNPEKVGLIGALENLARANAKVTDSTQLVDTEFAVMLSVLIDSVDKIKGVDGALRNSVGEASKQAAAGADTLAAAFADLRGASEEFAVSAGRGGVGAALASIATAGAGVLRELSGDAKAMKDASTSAKVLATALKLAGVAAGGFIGLRFSGYVVAVGESLKAMTTRAVAAAAATRTLDAATGTLLVSSTAASRGMAALSAATALSPFAAVALAIGATTAAMALFSSGSNEAKDRARKQAEEVERLREEYEGLYDALSKTKVDPGNLLFTGDFERVLRKSQDGVEKLARSLTYLQNTGKGSFDLENSSAGALFRALAGGATNDSSVAQIDALVQARRRALDEVKRLNEEQRQAFLELPADFSKGGVNPKLDALKKGITDKFAPSLEASQAVIDVTTKRLAELGAEADANGRVWINVAKGIDITTDASNRLQKKAGELGVQLERLNSSKEIGSQVVALIKEREKELEIAKLVGVEREKEILYEEARRRNGGILNDTERDRLGLLAQQLVDGQKLADQIREQAKEAEKLAQQQRDLPKNLAELQATYEDQLRLASAEREKRAEIQAEIKATNDAKAIGLALDSQEFEALKAQAIEIARLNEATKDQRRVDKGDKRVSDLFKQLKQDEEALRLVGDERDRYITRIQAQNDAEAAGLAQGTAIYQDYVRRRQALEELAKASEEAGQYFGQMGLSAGNALERIIIDGGRARDVVRALGQDLLRMAFQKNVTNNLQQLLTIAGQSLAGYFSGGSAPISGPDSATGRAGITNQSSRYGGNLYGGFQTGGIIPAMTGQIVAASSFLERGGRRYSVAEGGAVTPEAVFPLARDSRGRLGVVGAGGGGGDNVTMVFPSVRNAQDARGVRATRSQIARRIGAADRNGRRGLRPRGE